MHVGMPVTIIEPTLQQPLSRSYFVQSALSLDTDKGRIEEHSRPRGQHWLRASFEQQCQPHKCEAAALISLILFMRYSIATDFKDWYYISYADGLSNKNLWTWTCLFLHFLSSFFLTIIRRKKNLMHTKNSFPLKWTLRHSDARAVCEIIPFFCNHLYINLAILLERFYIA